MVSCVRRIFFVLWILVILYCFLWLVLVKVVFYIWNGIVVQSCIYILECYYYGIYYVFDFVVFYVVFFVLLFVFYFFMIWLLLKDGVLRSIEYWFLQFRNCGVVVRMQVRFIKIVKKIGDGIIFDKFYLYFSCCFVVFGLQGLVFCVFWGFVFQ